MIRTKDGHVISYIEKEINKSKPMVIMSHGITVDKSENGLFDILEKKFNRIDYNKIRYDFRGHGQSPIKDINCTIAGMILDLNEIYNYSSIKYEKVILLSTSFGSSINLLFLSQIKANNIDKVIFVNPVLSYRTTFTQTELNWGKSFFPQTGMSDAIIKAPIIIGSRKFKLSPNMAAEFYFYRPEEIGWNTDIHLFLHHGVKDDKVSFQTCREYHLKNSKSTSFYSYEDSHGIKKQREVLLKNIMENLNL